MAVEIKESSTGDTLRKVAAAIVGVIIIIVLVLLAKWLGDRIRERFFVSPAVVTTQTVPADNSGDKNASATSGGTVKVSTYSAIPATGASDLGYALIAFLALSGLSTLAVARRTIKS